MISLPPSLKYSSVSPILRSAASVEKMSHCENPEFGVNIVENSNFEDGTKGWFPNGTCTLTIAFGSPLELPSLSMHSLAAPEPLSGRYIIATNRSITWNGPAQKITDKIKLFLTYQISAWVRISPGPTPHSQIVNFTLAVDSHWVHPVQIMINDDQWHELAGSFRFEKQPSKVVAFVESPAPGVDLMVAGLQIFSVNRRARFPYLKQLTDKIRKRDVILKFSGAVPGKLIGGFVNVRQTRNSFPFGSCIRRAGIDNKDYVDFFVKNFNWAVLENELNWSYTEPQQGTYNYADADGLMNFCQRHGIKTRCHCIFLGKEDMVQPWVRSLNKNDLMGAVQNRLKCLITRYKGKFMHYDVNNKMLHESFYQNRLGDDIGAYMFKMAHKLDPSATLFVHDYHIQDECNTKPSPEKYIKQVLDLQARSAPVGGIGIDGRIDHPVGTIVCAALDKLSPLGIPIWLTQIAVRSSNENVRADDLEVMLREAFAHPAVDGILLAGFWETFMNCENAHLVNTNGDVNEAGKRYIALKQEWMSHVSGHISDRRDFRFRGFPGTYDVEIVNDSNKFFRTFVVDKGESPIVITI